MSAIELLDRTANDGKGDGGRTITEKIERNLQMLYERTQQAFSLKARLRFGTFGDSIAGNAGGPQTSSGISQGISSPLFWASSVHNPIDIHWDVKPGYFGLADDELGSGYAEGGTRTERMLTHQLPLLKARLKTRRLDGLFMSPMQNDGVGDRAGAITSTNNVIEAIKQIIDLGLHLVVQGNIPYDGIATPERMYAIYFSNDRVRNFCAKTTGVRFIDSLDYLKEKVDVSPELLNGEIGWLGPRGGKYGTGGDTAHLATYAGYLTGHLFAEALEDFGPTFRMPSFGPAPFNKDQNEFGNFYSSRGTFLSTDGMFKGAGRVDLPREMRGVGGKLNGVIRNDVPEGVEITIEPGAGITYSTVTLADGTHAPRFTADGSVCTANGMVEVALVSIADAAGDFEAYGIVQDIAAEGWSGIEMAVNAHAYGGYGGPGNLIPGVSNRRYTMRTPRPRYFSNQFQGVQKMTFRSAFVQGERLAGAWQVERATYVGTEPFGAF